MLVPRIISRNVHQKFAKILPAQEAYKGPRRVLDPLNHVFAILDPSLADPARDIAHEIPIAPEKVGDDETAKRQPFGQDRSYQVRQEDRTGWHRSGVVHGDQAAHRNAGERTEQWENGLEYGAADILEIDVD